MEMTGARRIDVPRQQVWNALLDPETLRACIPGCTGLTGDAAEGFEAVVVQKVGPVKATFRGQVTLTDADAPQSLTLTGEGKGGVAGFAKGTAWVRLTSQGDATDLEYEVEAKVGGKLAQLGSRVIDGFARKMADDFFARLQDRLSAPAGAAADRADPREPVGD
ncbi:carbon monoxide dehydrogenase operon G protein [Oceaniovalibus guishaninsula JLT2003]|uniref:Carbon monoxide dehydrogenase operon G protein n=1 Tax=Oceaniovalibus guishaninsula JLT2003 TaxID=1231392 RepID=K2HED8_9RHOB|nr:carbon monoxide dehydrogenase subunit G [Oceaniovalibus guishaninsula]EKE45828.1 carbon monoxide dehydrogenase operon G protein [Oceaniovalibus guishaninsula JLT2003]